MAAMAMGSFGKVDMLTFLKAGGRFADILALQC